MEEESCKVSVCNVGWLLSYCNSVENVVESETTGHSRVVAERSVLWPAYQIFSSCFVVCDDDEKNEECDDTQQASFVRRTHTTHNNQYIPFHLFLLM
jgi:hypothetical protein